MIEKPIFRYGPINSGQLCKLFRSPDVYIPSADDHTSPDDIMNFIDNALASPVMFAIGRDPRYEAFIFAPSHNATTFQAHVAIRADKRDGSVVYKIAEAVKWLFDHTPCRSVISFIREDNKGMRSVLAQGGVTRRGKIKDSVLFDGETRDELIYQMSAQEFNDFWGDQLGRVE